MQRAIVSQTFGQARAQEPEHDVGRGGFHVLETQGDGFLKIAEEKVAAARCDAVDPHTAFKLIRADAVNGDGVDVFGCAS